MKKITPTSASSLQSTKAKFGSNDTRINAAKSKEDKRIHPAKSIRKVSARTRAVLTVAKDRKKSIPKEQSESEDSDYAEDSDPEFVIPDKKVPLQEIHNKEEHRTLLSEAMARVEDN